MEKQLDIAALGFRVDVLQNTEETLEIDVVGRPRGFLLQAHVHESQVERHEMISGSLKLVIDGKEHLLGPGDALEVPAGAAHRQLPAGSGPGHDHITIRPAGNTLAFMARLERLS